VEDGPSGGDETVDKTRVIAVGNSKGGTGKTTTAVNLGHGLVLRGYNVLLVDLDSQGNLSVSLGVKPNYMLYDILISGMNLDEVITPARHYSDAMRGRLDIIASDWRTARAKEILAGQNFREEVLARSMRAVKGYDYIILDCAPSLDLLNINAILYAQEAIIPVAVRTLDLVGVRQYIETMRDVRQVAGRGAHLLFVLPTFVDARTRLSGEVRDALERSFPHSLASPIRINVRLAEAAGHGQTIFEYDSKASGAQDYSRLVEEVVAHER